MDELPAQTSVAWGKLQAALRPGEEILASVRTNTNLARNHVLIVTSSRVIIIKRISLSYTVKLSSFEMNQITSITQGKAPGIKTGYLSIHTRSDITPNGYYNFIDRLCLMLFQSSRFEPWGYHIFNYSTLSDRPLKVQRILGILGESMMQRNLGPLIITRDF